MARYVCAVLLLLFSFSPTYAQNSTCPKDDPTRNYWWCRPGPGQQADPGQRQLEQERAALQQRERELQQHIQQQQLLQQRIQQQQARQQQQRRDRQNSEWQQLGDTWVRETGRIQAEQDREEAEQEREEARAREAKMQDELRALRKQLEDMRAAPQAIAPAQTPEPRGSTQTGARASQPPQAAEDNPFAKEAEKEAQAAKGMKDPSVNHAGSECSYFTKPLVREGGSGLNIYADGSMVCYGKTMYKCVRRHWTSVGRCDMYDKGQQSTAEQLEN